MRREAGGVSPPAPVGDEPVGKIRPDASRWALGLFWASLAFAAFALVLLISSFFT